ncbi:hypothetical protein ECC02_010128 [Trypanosoma cruzi]|uniref:Uncharacterized protein n=1 Tax=Trypanosoma cruzi TaxID=5693 RepID=A0A7J6XRE9_TRYCR|nr:hypothetical protein ECC02_010128 [Trypanosoma cruzi]
MAVTMLRVRWMEIMTMINGPTAKKHTTTPKMIIPTLLPNSVRLHSKHQKQSISSKHMILQQKAIMTAAPRSPTPPPLFFLLLRVRLLLRWWPRESEGERAVHRPHTHSSFTHSLCVSPCMDSRPHLTPRGTHIMCPLYICMHTHAGPLVLSFARHAPLPSCLAAWAEHRNSFKILFACLLLNILLFFSSFISLFFFFLSLTPPFLLFFFAIGGNHYGRSFLFYSSLFLSFLAALFL